MEFRLLGPLEVRAGDGPLPLGGAKQRALLALLLLNANRVVAARAADRRALGRGAAGDGGKAVQLYVSQLRKLLPEGTLVTRRAGYVLEVEPEAIDLQRFERLVARGARRRARARGAAAAARRSSSGAARRWPSSATSRSPAIEAGRLEDLRLAALEERIDADLALGRHARARRRARGADRGAPAPRAAPRRS